MQSERQRSPVPLVPPSILRKHRVFRASDTRFRACARLLQSIWREQAGLAVGLQPARTKPARRLGSLLSQHAADQGRNFLLPAVAQLARRELIYREHGAFIEEDRLFRNLLSSMPLTFNLFAPLRFNSALAAKVLHSLLPGLGISTVTSIHFEHAPRPRHGPALSNRTALDAAATYTTTDGMRGFIGFEVKYSEAMTSAPALGPHPSYDERAPASGLFLEPSACALRRAPLEQLFREHLLVQSAFAAGHWDHASFIMIAPRDNDHVQRAATAYATHLTDAGNGPVPFINLHLERMMGAIASAGEPTYAQALHHRYTDWHAVSSLIEQELAEHQPGWDLVLGNAPTPVALLGAA